MIFVARNFDELTNSELYEILKARCEIFALEKGIRYQDMDDLDYTALHCILMEERRVLAYLRAYYMEEGSPNTVKIGRVLTIRHGLGHGRLLMERSLSAIGERRPCETVLVNAQMPAVGFYQRMGFHRTSEEFMEAGIPHLEMQKGMTK